MMTIFCKCASAKAEEGSFYLSKRLHFVIKRLCDFFVRMIYNNFLIPFSKFSKVVCCAGIL